MPCRQSKPADIVTSTARRRLARCRRQGTSVTELAVCMPVIMLIAIATIEACTMVFLQQSLSIAAYEGARLGVAPSVTSTVVTDQVIRILDDRDVQGATVDVSPSNLTAVADGSWFTVRATAKFGPNSLAGGWLFGARTLSATVQMMKER
mgnify:FL=1